MNSVLLKLWTITITPSGACCGVDVDFAHQCAAMNIKFRGSALKEMGRPEETLASYDLAPAARAGYADTLNIDGMIKVAVQRGLATARAIIAPLIIAPNDPSHSDIVARPSPELTKPREIAIVEARRAGAAAAIALGQQVSALQRSRVQP